MLESGYLEECQRILDSDWDVQAKPLQSFSYKYWLRHLQGGLSFDEAKERTEIGTWHLARKQRTWARNIGWEAKSPSETQTEAFKWLMSLR